ncbi:LAFA_0G13212g1_1 [Lachancea sp. 'fantastica']|nr:LAFA_0G13212g1_1 [Lachancea sp. 'fantastica']
MKLDFKSNKLRPSFLALATAACLWFSILTSLLAIILLHVPSVSCNSLAGPRFCIPQYTVRFLEVPNPDQNIFVGAKSLLTLLSYVALDLNAKGKAANLEDYDDVNLVNTFNSPNRYKVNHLGYCKEQPSVTKIPRYCINNRNGLEPVSTLIRDVGVQFGITSSKNPYMMGNSFVYAFKLGLSTLLEAGKNGTTHPDDNVFAKYVTNDPSSDSDAPVRDLSRWQSVAELLVVLQHLCWSISFINLVEFLLCVLVVISTIITAPTAFTGKQRDKKFRKIWRIVDIWGHFALKILPIVVAIVSFFGVFISTVLYMSLSRASSTQGLSRRYYDLQVGGAFYVNVARLVLECVLIWQTVKFNQHRNNAENELQLSPAPLESWQKDIEMDSILSSSTTV